MSDDYHRDKFDAFSSSKINEMCENKTLAMVLDWPRWNSPGMQDFSRVVTDRVPDTFQKLNFGTDGLDSMLNTSRAPLKYLWVWSGSKRRSIEAGKLCQWKWNKKEDAAKTRRRWHWIKICLIYFLNLCFFRFFRFSFPRHCKATDASGCFRNYGKWKVTL